MTQSPNLSVIENFTLDGGLNDDNLTYLKQTVSSALYLCQDSSDDIG
jgi:hypothetical protein